MPKQSTKQPAKPTNKKSSKAKPALTPSWSLLSRSLQLIQQHPFSLLWLVLIPSILSAIGSALTPHQSSEAGANVSYSELFNQQVNFISNHPIALAISAIAGLWLLLVYPATVVMASRIARGDDDDPAKFVLQSRHYFWRLYGLAIVTGVVVFLGFLAFIIPGLIFLRRYSMAPYYLVTQDLGVFEAMRLSSAESKPVSGYVWGTIGVAVAISIVSSLFLSVPWVGPLLGPLAAIVYYFGMPLRQREIAGN